MILTPIDHETLPPLLEALTLALAPHPRAARALARIAAVIPAGDLMELSTEASHHAHAVALCRAFGLEVVDMSPADGLTWDGRRVAGRMEPSVLIHEVAHFQCASLERRSLPDFGLGAGPESGWKEVGDRARRLPQVEADVEEALSSLLGILWEAEFGQPAILAFAEQNWLEGGAASHNVAHLIRMTDMLADLGLIDDEARPRYALREQTDDVLFAPWRSP